MTTSLALRFPGLSRPVHLHDAPAPMAALAGGLAGWTPTIALPDPALSPLATVTGLGAAHAVQSAWLTDPLDGLTATAAFCGILADLTEGWLADRPDHLALHAGGFIAGGQAIALSGPARAGKSTLIARLTMEPWARVLGDDVLPIDPQGTALGLGIPPRLRQPLPPGAGRAFRRHVAGHLGSFDQQYAYLSPATVALHGTAAPLRMLVVLTRQATGPARLHHLPRDQAVAHLLARNIAPPGHGQGGLPLIHRLDALAQGLTCLRLVYASLDDAVEALRALATGNAWIAAAPPGPPDFAAPPAPAADLHATWQRNPDVGVTTRAGCHYLWQRAGQTHVALNAVAMAVWTLLDEPATGCSIVQDLAVAFPATPPATIAADVAGLLGQMAATGLITPA